MKGGASLKKIIVDGKAITSMDELHNTLHLQFGFPDYYGRNLDALWDMLTGGIELPVTIEWQSYATSSERLGEEGQRLLELLREAEQELEGGLTVIVHE
ncbi:putative barstar [Aneurinibacillus aneurinilyticus ATCC 12856]|uniref:Putative barstar n=1 Tax=Aneurinibacillus aneurinilyticus ATCC 12856 TaxID=649747 RepID=U1Y9A9_ANEAE|nr:putative barstar [Aneurinibacillus aneurinilyticus ATCC 12856]